MGERTLDTLDRRICEIREEKAEGRIDAYEARDRLVALDRERMEALAGHFTPMPDFVRGFVQLANEAAEVLGRVHYVDVHHDGIPTMEWYASCSCDWMGDRKNTPDEAIVDGHNHLDMMPEGPWRP